MESDLYKAYHKDLTLLMELGLKPWEAKHGEEKYIGQVNGRDYLVKIWVTCLPAQFYRFVIERGHTYEVTTGSGVLSNYWPSIKLIAEGMLAIKFVKKS